jgi:hypothetical protein
MKPYFINDSTQRFLSGLSLTPSIQLSLMIVIGNFSATPDNSCKNLVAEFSCSLFLGFAK